MREANSTLKDVSEQIRPTVACHWLLLWRAYTHVWMLWTFSHSLWEKRRDRSMVLITKGKWENSEKETWNASTVGIVKICHGRRRGEDTVCVSVLECVTDISGAKDCKFWNPLTPVSSRSPRWHPPQGFMDVRSNWKFYQGSGGQRALWQYLFNEMMQT